MAALAASGALLAVGAGAALSASHAVELTPVLGTEDYAPGPVRVSFLLLDGQGATVYRNDLRVRVSPAGGAPTLAVARPVLEPVGVPGAGAGDITRLYVLHFRVSRAGTYRLAVEATGEIGRAHV